ncbi:MAG: hypothetical protein JXR73_23120 [Candidatus Omnitrophica bacterium]|nr:hypothetical protein [Candidatus Omnitrophota bacterium]
MEKKSVLSLAVFLLIGAGIAGAQPVGIFDNMSDVGEPNFFGYAEFDNDEYLVEGVGATVGNETLNDQFFFLNNEMAGSFAIEAFPEYVDAGDGGIMVRATLDDDSPHVSIMVDSQMRNYPHIRTIKGGGTIYDGDPEPAASVKLRLERLGNSVHMYTVDENGNATYLQTEVALFGETVRAGLAATGGSADGISTFFFREVMIEEFPLNVVRSVPTNELQPGASLSGITVTAKVMDGQTSDAVIQEVVPDGATIANVQSSAGEAVDNGDGTISWTLTGLSGEATLTYDLTLGSDDYTAVWRGMFNDGVHLESYIGGDMLLPEAPTYSPKGVIDVDPYFPTLIQAEFGTPTDLALEDFGLFFDPRTSNGIALVAIDEPNEESLIQFTLNIPADGTYYLFGNAREEDGNSDSFHTDMDIPPVDEDICRWNVSADKDFQVQWVSVEDPGLDPRPFELTAGEHVFNLMSREDSASLDWIAVTTNPSLDLANPGWDAKSLASRIVSDDFLEESEAGADVELSVYIREGVTDSAILTEIPPSNMTLKDLAVTGGSFTQNADGSITWDVTGVTGEGVKMTYSVEKSGEVVNYAAGAFFTGEFVLGADDPIVMDNSLVIEGTPVDPIGKTVYFFGNINNNEIGDQFIISELRTLFGLDVVLYDDGNNAGLPDMPADLSGADMAFISGSVGSGNMVDMNYHVNDEEPIIFNESYIADDYAFQPGTNGGSEGVEIEIVDNEHPITQGFDLGLLQVFNNSHGLGGLNDPPEGVRVLAIEPGNPDLAVLYIFEKGASANGSSTPGDRISIFYGGGGLLDMTAAGRRLYNQIFAYSLNIEAPDVGVHDFMLY